jgi:hypothetical protein
MTRPAVLFTLAFGLVTLSPPVSAQIGMPPTPVGVAGVARQNTGRAVAPQSSTVAGSGVDPKGAATTLTSLPPGCADTTVANVVYKKCGATYYRPYYQGSNLVYVPATP